LEWKDRKYLEYLIPILGGMGEFTYLKFKIADPTQRVDLLDYHRQKTGNESRTWR